METVEITNARRLRWELARKGIKDEAIFWLLSLLTTASFDELAEAMLPPPKPPPPGFEAFYYECGKRAIF